MKNSSGVTVVASGNSRLGWFAARVQSNLTKKKLAVGLAFLAAGCASQPEDIAAAYVSPTLYASYSCDQVQAEMQRVSARARGLETRLKSEADADAVQMGVGLILFWPTLLFLEGGDSPEAQEFARLKGEKEALEKVSVQKECGLGFKSASRTQTGTAALALVPQSSSPTQNAPLVALAKAANPDGRDGQELFDAGDYAGAASAWQSAAEAGDAIAMRNLGALYEDGQGVSQSFVQAHLHYNLAAARGDDEARQARNLISGRMTPESLARAQQLAEVWPGSASAPRSPPAQVQTASVPAPGPYDGMWRFTLDYRQGPTFSVQCDDRSFKVDLQVSRGSVDGSFNDPDYGSHQLRGEVQPDGRLARVVGAGLKVIRMHGALNTSSGSGTWESAHCKGSWTAVRISTAG